MQLNHSGDEIGAVAAATLARFARLMLQQTMMLMNLTSFAVSSPMASRQQMKYIESSAIKRKML